MAAAAIPEGSSQTARGLSTRLHTPLESMVIPPARCRWSFPSMMVLDDTRHLPRAPSPEAGVTCLGETFNISSAGVTQPSQLILAHAPHQIPPADLGLRPIQQVFAGCCEPLLEGGGSRRYLHSPCVGAWTHTPPRPLGALARFFPRGNGLTNQASSSTRESFPTMQLLWGRNFEAAVISLCSGSHTH